MQNPLIWPQVDSMQMPFKYLTSGEETLPHQTSLQSPVWVLSIWQTAGHVQAAPATVGTYQVFDSAAFSLAQGAVKLINFSEGSPPPPLLIPLHKWDQPSCPPEHEAVTCLRTLPSRLPHRSAIDLMFGSQTSGVGATRHLKQTPGR